MNADGRPWRVLVVCTANRCRSPIGEGLVAIRLADAGIDAVVRSCGRLGDGSPIDPYSVRAMREMGVDIDGTVSQPLHAPTLTAADLIITMERAHVRDVATVDMASWTKTFPLRELVRRAHLVGGRGGEETIGDWVRRIHAGRTGADMLDRSITDDIADPLGGSLDDFRRCAQIIDSYVTQFVRLAAPRAASDASPRDGGAADADAEADRVGLIVDITEAGTVTSMNGGDGRRGTGGS